MRGSLKQGEQLVLENKIYVIDAVIGEGANCLVYDAHVLEDGVCVRIKELYPAQAKIKRQGTALLWESEEEKQKEEARFRAAYKKNVEIQNKEAFRNVTSQVSNFATANNTWYMVVDVVTGMTFDKDKTEKLDETVVTVLALSKTVLEYHKQGYLFLDLKPQNFLIIRETRKLVKIIDVDSVCPLQDILSGKAETLAFTKGWAAPELEQNKISAIGIPTDIYAIGAILFERLFHRVPTSQDRGLFRQWRVENVIEGVYSPTVYTLLTDILKKCLNPTVSKRYQTIEELILDLKRLSVECGRTEFIKSDYTLISDQSNFVGRETEFARVHELLQQNRAVFLWGFAGMGKTMLALKYIERYREAYDAVVFFRYEGSLDDFFMSVPIGEKCSEQEETEEAEEMPERITYKETVKRRYNRVKQLANERTLFIIDNFDVSDDPRLEDLLEINAKILFTSRMSSQEIESSQVAYFNLESLSLPECLELFEKEQGHAFTQDEVQYAIPIIERYERHSYLTVLVAKYARKSGKSVREIYNELNTEGIAHLGEDTDNVRHRKDGANRSDNIYGHMRELIGIMELTEEHIRVIENIYYITQFCVPVRERYRQLTGALNFNMLDDMVERGLVTRVAKREELPFDLGSDNIYYVYTLHQIVIDLYCGLQRDKRESAVYHVCYDTLQQTDYLSLEQENDFVLADFLSGHFCVRMPMVMKGFLAFVDSTSIRDDELELLVRILVDIFENGKGNPLKEMLTNMYDYRKDSARQLPEAVLSWCLQKHDTAYKGGKLPWWYALIVLSVSYYKTWHATKKESEYATKALTAANEGMLQYLESIENTVSESDRRYVGKILQYEISILSSDVFYAGVKIYHTQRQILADCGYVHRENNGVWIGLREKTNNEALQLYYSIVPICRKWSTLFGGQEGSEEFEHFGKAVIWELAYLDGSFLNPLQVELSECVRKENLLRFFDRKKWEEKLTESFVRTIGEPEGCSWLYRLLLDDIFLREQPMSLIKKVSDLFVFDKIAKDATLSAEEKKYLLSEYAVQNCNRFLAANGKRWTKQGRVEKASKQLLSYYAQNVDYLEKELFEEPFSFDDRSRFILWNLVVLYSLLGCREQAESVMKRVFTTENAVHIGQFVLLAKNIKKSGYTFLYKEIADCLLRQYAVNRKARAWKVQVRNAIALCKIAPYYGKNSVKKQLTEYIESKLTVDNCEAFFETPGVDDIIKESAFEIVLQPINDALALQLYEKKETVCYSWEPEEGELKRKVKVAIGLSEKHWPYFRKDYIGQEERWVLRRLMHPSTVPITFDGMLYSGIHNPYEKHLYYMLMRWYKKRRRYDLQGRYIGAPYLVSLAYVGFDNEAAYVFKAVEKEKLQPICAELYDTVGNEIEMFCKALWERRDYADNAEDMPPSPLFDEWPRHNFDEDDDTEGFIGVPDWFDGEDLPF